MIDVDLSGIASEEEISTIVYSHKSSGHLGEVKLQLVLVILVTGCDLRVLEEFPITIGAWLKFRAVATEDSLVVSIRIQEDH